MSPGRKTWFEAQRNRGPERLIFVDESCAGANMARRHGRCSRDGHRHMAIPHNR